MEKIFCNTCKMGYKDIFSKDSNQAFDCASDVVLNENKKIIYSHYGSNFDTQKHFVKEPSDIELGVICDCCIEESLRKNKITEDNNYDYWGNIPPVGNEFPNLEEDNK